MDAKRFGAFIAEVRKEQNMTQADLARKLQVTDKAVSKWERGAGLPDINSLEPLAQALGVGIVELMRSERMAEPSIDSASVDEVLTDTFEIVRHQRRQERRTVIKIIAAAALLVLGVFLADATGWVPFVFIYFPVICLLASVAALIYGIWRRRNKLPCLQTFIVAGILFFVPLAVVVFFFLVGALGIGPVPN